ncbi:hypothetical protein G114_16940 [Aeromonas diversa CDC 2478-85]|uniref:Lipoprotein n=1 Tax=Aeromonas diversa CDC 2478-85 TaxID=1268237 RepID=N9VGI8_9GAMM|nr:hypothetical protein [Aeromonas diversa]ENY70713.1 hypothetical protein G114_16940 [Aeromonas diversa CDC 2478-85]
MNERLLLGALVLTLGACAQQSIALHQQGGSSQLTMNTQAPLDLSGRCGEGETLHIASHQGPVEGLLTLASLGSYRPDARVDCKP